MPKDGMLWEAAATTGPEEAQQKKQSSQKGSKRGYILNTFKGKVKEFEGNNYDCTDENNLKNVERLVTKAADYIVTQIKLVVS